MDSGSPSPSLSRCRLLKRWERRCAPAQIRIYRTQMTPCKVHHPARARSFHLHGRHRLPARPREPWPFLRPRALGASILSPLLFPIPDLIQELKMSLFTNHVTKNLLLVVVIPLVGALAKYGLRRLAGVATLYSVSSIPLLVSFTARALSPACAFSSSRAFSHSCVFLLCSRRFPYFLQEAPRFTHHPSNNGMPY